MSSNLYQEKSPLIKKDERVEKVERVERVEKVEKVEKVERVERVEKVERVVMPSALISLPKSPSGRHNYSDGGVSPSLNSRFLDYVFFHS
jgi:hypothetical protein